GCAKAGELPHGPQAAAMHSGMDATGVGRLSRITEFCLCIPVRQIGFGVEPANRMAGNRCELPVTLGIFLQNGRKRFFFPGSFFGRRIANCACLVFGRKSRSLLVGITHWEDSRAAAFLRSVAFITISYASRKNGREQILSNVINA